MTQEPIAIIGIGCRFPGGIDDPASFWNFLKGGGDAIQEVPADRWNPDKFYDPDPVVPGKMNSRCGGFLSQIDQFDASFFGISGAEAARLDPQQRIALEVAWEALEDAGQVLERLAGSDTGVFMGAFSRDYSYLQLDDLDTITAHTLTSSNLNMVPNRISYWFDFTGPSLPVDAGCASSLVAVHLACSSIWQGDCRLALAGGVNVICKPEISIALSKAFLLASDGRCKSFAANADGMGRAEGAGVVVLKPLTQAVSDGDAIYAAIRGSAFNQNGRGNSFTAPEGRSQQAAIRKAYEKAGIAPQRVRYVEAQGSGTRLTDEVEAMAIGSVIGGDRPPGSECVIGSVKTNIGHAEAAAGIASLIKATLAIAHRQIPPHLHCQFPNLNIPWQDLRLRVPSALEPLADPEDGFPIAGVNALGIGGTNVHVVLQAIELDSSNLSESAVSESPSEPHLFILSAQRPAALTALVSKYLEWFNHQTTCRISLTDICYTVSLRRSHHRHRLAFIVHSQAQLVENLKAFLTEQQPFPASLLYPTPLHILAERYCQGESIDWHSLYSSQGRFVRLPTYPWQRLRYWHESEASWQRRVGSEPASVSPGSTDSDQSSSTVLEDWLKATGGDRIQRLISYFQDQVAQVLNCSPAHLDVQQPLNRMGIDSLTAVSFRSQIANHLKIDLPIEQLMASPSIAELAQLCHEQLVWQRLSASDSSTQETAEDVETLMI